MMKIGDRVTSLTSNEPATVLEVSDMGIRLIFDSDAEFAERYGTSIKRCSNVLFDPSLFRILD